VATVIVLPGTDGTGSLLLPFVRALGVTTRVVVVSYPTQEVLGYRELEQWVRPLLPTEGPYVLLGESFGGPLAITIAASRPAGLVGLVLSTSFARYPGAWWRSLAPLARLAPVRMVPRWMLSWLLLGRWATPELLGMLEAATRAVAPRVLRARAREALRVDVSGDLGRVAVPVLHLRASNDRVVGRRAAADIRRWAPHTRLSQLPGPHFLLQAQPQACARVVQEFVADC
jgi:pimeloyl-[acyl-carrier protein] methyl ester esterase